MTAMEPVTLQTGLQAAQAVVSVGQAGAWIGPLLVGLAAAVLDYSAIGPHAMRDRLAVAGYYAAAISFVYLLGLATWEQSAFHDYNWRMLGAVASLITHGALLLAMFGTIIGPTRTLAKNVQARVKFAVAETSGATKVNQPLLGWTVAAAVTAPLSGTSGWGGFVAGIASATTGLWSGIVSVVMSWLGG
jgi:hypothetical protein